MEVARLVHTHVDEELEFVVHDKMLFEPFVFHAPLASPVSGSSEVFIGSPKASNDKDTTNLQLKSDDEEIEIKESLFAGIDAERLKESLAVSPLKAEVPAAPLALQTPFDFPELSGKYRVLEKIGEGTFSSVYKAICLANNRVVALKRINPTCSPDRILNEMKHLHLLGGKAHVSPLLGAHRCGDQITLVLPCVEHEKFKDYLPTMTVQQIKEYMRALFRALEHLHAHKVIHRDLKPGNFLYNPKTNEFVLVDFGLAQHQTEVTPDPPPSGDKLASPLKRRRSEGVAEPQSAKRAKYPTVSSRVNSPVTVSRIVPNVSKKSLRAPRGGTRGFRAPEVLMKSFDQTVAIDVWSAGVILLCILSTRYPFFNAPDDLVSLAELSALFGTKEVREVALLLNRRIRFPFDPLDIPKPSLQQVCNLLSCRKEPVPDSAFHLLSRCLDINPHTRITASQALKHPFLSET